MNQVIRSTQSEGDVHVSETFIHSDFNEWKVEVSTEYEHRDAMQSLPFSRCHQKWNGDRGAWTMDLMGLPLLVLTLMARDDITVTVEQDVVEQYWQVRDEAVDNAGDAVQDEQENSQVSTPTSKDI